MVTNNEIAQALIMGLTFCLLIFCVVKVVRELCNEKD